MEEYILKLENSFGNQVVAIFTELKRLFKYVADNPPQKKCHYYVVVKTTIETRLKM